MDPVKGYPLSRELVEAIGKYLITRPWGEVNGLVYELKKQVDAIEAERAVVDQLMKNPPSGAEAVDAPPGLPLKPERPWPKVPSPHRPPTVKAE